MTGDGHPLLDVETVDDARWAEPHGEVRREPTLTVLGHPQAARVGERARLPELARAGGRAELSRGAPGFATGPLLTPSLSRNPLVLRRDRGGLQLDPSATTMACTVDGITLSRAVSLTAERLESGVVIGLGEHVVLLLHLESVDAEAPPEMGMLGASDGVRELRRAVGRHGPTPGPVLIRGETGAGKELVARALHAASGRRDGPLVSVNVAAIPPSLAASELFGHHRGAFSGASESRDGYFVRADGGTLFLDEIGAAPADLQAALLRVLETGEVQPVGGRALRRVDVRLVAATDLNLEAAIRDERFSAPLYYRLATREIRVPPLRVRRSDVGTLLVHFLTEELSRLGAEALLVPPPERVRAWLPGRLITRLALYDWPGNIRQLRNVALWLAGFADRAAAPVDHPELASLLGASASAAPPASPAPSAPTTAAASSPRRQLEDIADAEVLSAMEAADYRLVDAARTLGVSRPSMNALVDRNPDLARAVQLSRAQVEAARARAAATDEPLWRVLRVSRQALKRRLSELGIGDA